MPADADGVRIAELDEKSFREKLWDHKPITDFWRVGAGTARRLAKLGLFTMGDVAQYSESCEDVLYKTFGVNAELLIDHAWGWEPCTIGDAKSFKPQTNSLSQGQVMTRPYEYKEAGIIVREMAELLSLDLVRKGMVTDQIVLTIGYESVKDAKSLGSFEGELTLDRYGRITPKHAHGTYNLDIKTSSTKLIREAAGSLYERIMDKDLCMRRLSIAACNIIPESEAKDEEEYEQLSLFTDFEKEQEERRKREVFLEKEKNLQKASLEVKQKYGKNAIIKGMNLLDGATTITRNAQIGGHKA
ncbi:MAG: DNA methylase, partial [Lachnospiraceae bacterium]|nr:DNA methylase [Lachnospiraceae bacterium]